MENHPSDLLARAIAEGELVAVQQLMAALPDQSACCYSRGGGTWRCDAAAAGCRAGVPAGKRPLH